MGQGQASDQLAEGAAMDILKTSMLGVLTSRHVGLTRMTESNRLQTGP